MRFGQSARRAGSFLLVASLALRAFAGRASAHVKYVTPGNDPVAVAEFLVDALTDPFNAAVLLGGAAR